jgi:KTSC domain
MERLPVTSSMAKSIGHDPFQSILEIEFTSGEVYQYLKVPQEVYKEMLTFSIGRYFQAFIKNRYEERRVWE